MKQQQQIVINLADVADDAEALGKLYELGSIMVQSNNSDEVKAGYELLDLVGERVKSRQGQSVLKNG